MRGAVTIPKGTILRGAGPVLYSYRSRAAGRTSADREHPSRRGPSARAPAAALLDAGPPLLLHPAPAALRAELPVIAATTPFVARLDRAPGRGGPWPVMFANAPRRPRTAALPLPGRLREANHRVPHARACDRSALPSPRPGRGSSFPGPHDQQRNARDRAAQQERAPPQWGPLVARVAL